ncbi:MAG: hypothetical protein JXQ87_04610 [Bacteroidia bacterium]
MKVEKLKIDATERKQPMVIYGISAAIDFYRMAYFLSKTFEQEPEKFTNQNFNEHPSLTFYKFALEEDTLILIKNHQPEGLFFSKAKLADYLLIALGPSVQLNIDSAKNDLSKVGSVQSIFAIEEKFFTKTKLKYFDQTSF